MLEFRPICAAEYETVIDELLIPNFSLAERGPRAELLADFQSGQYIGTAVWDGETEKPLATAVGWRVTGESVLLSWLAVDKAARGGGIGGKLLDTSIRTWEETYQPALILGEIESPYAYGEHPEYGNPQARWRFYQRHGARRIDIPYAMPSLAPDLPPVEDMWLLLFGGRAYQQAEILEEPGSFAAHFGDDLREFLLAYLESSVEIRTAGHYRPAVEEMLGAIAQTRLI